MQTTNTASLAVAACLIAGLFLIDTPLKARAASPVPEFIHTRQADWLNSPPLSLATLRGKVVLLEFWTFDCINCRRSIPWVKSIQTRMTDKDLVIIAIHTPELPQEKRRENVVAAVKQLGITYPVMLDMDYSYWNALDNHYWPAFYLIDKTGSLREVAIGEMHVGETRAALFENKITALLQSNAAVRVP